MEVRLHLDIAERVRGVAERLDISDQDTLVLTILRGLDEIEDHDAEEGQPDA